MLTWRKTALNTVTNVCRGDGYAKMAHNLLRKSERHFGLRSIGKSGFRICNRTRKNGFHLREICPQGGFQLGNPITDFMDFLFTVRLGNPKKDSQNCSRELRSTFC